MLLGDILERIKLKFSGGSTLEPIAIARAEGAIPPGPVPGSKLTPEFVREIGRFAYLWGWTQGWVKTQTFLVGGVAPIARSITSPC